MKKIPVVLLAILLLGSVQAFAVNDMFLKLVTIQGESVDSAHAGEIDILSWSWSMKQQYSSGGGSTTGKVVMDEIVLSKYVDKASPLLMLAVCNGQTQTQATFIVRHAGSTPFEWLKITLENVVVTRVTPGGKREDDRLTETISLNFKRVRVEYTEQKADGSAGTKTSFGWDLVNNVAL